MDGGKRIASGRVAFAFDKVRRCKLDPGLKAPGFNFLIVKKDNSAFQLEPYF